MGDGPGLSDDGRTAVGQALLGHKPGEKIDLPTETGTEKVEIISIEAYRAAAAAH